jgi:hypothetical protein
MRFSRTILTILLLAVMPSIFLAQQQEPLVAFGGLRVPSCTVSTDPEYGLTQNKPIQIGGSPLYAAARMARYIGAIRGPQGQTLQLGNTRGSLAAPAGYWDEPTILDSYQVSYEGKSVGLYVDSYHFSLPKAPMGFTCGGPLVTALGMPPLDTLKMNSALVAHAIERGTVKDVVPVSLDPATSRGYLMDQHMMIALRARAAATSGTPLDPGKPPAGLDASALTVLAYPMTCGDRTIAPQNVEISAAQQPLPRIGDFVRGDAVKSAFPGMTTPDGSIGGRFRTGQVNQVKITYAEACEGAAAEVLLPLRLEPPRIMAVPGTIPTGVSEPDPTVYLQVIFDSEGHFVRPLHIGGPKSLVQAAIETIGTWRAEPVRLNGTPVINPMLLQVIFR